MHKPRAGSLDRSKARLADRHSVRRDSGVRRDVIRDSATLEQLISALNDAVRAPDTDLRSLVEQIGARLSELVPLYAGQLRSEEALAGPLPEDRWWIPEDISAPPTTERVAPGTSGFTREDVELVLEDL